MKLDLPHSKDEIRITFGVTGKDGVFHEITPTPIRPPRWERCIFCEAQFDLNNLHPGHVKCFGDHPRVCRPCGLCFAPYGQFWSYDLETRILNAKETAGRGRKCYMCANEFNLLGSFYKHMWYKNIEHPNWEMPDTIPRWDYWIKTEGLDFLYPNLYTDICPQCFRQIFSGYRTCAPHDQIMAVRELGERIGKLPARNFPSYIYYYHDKPDIEWFLSLLHRLPNPESISQQFGSYFKLLIQSGLLPDGARRMRLGTWSIAKDGDQCFSLVERDIDDWLFRNGITHAKEVKYPGCDMRCDWEVSKGGRRIFIEYFGLMNQATYAEKAAQKKLIANQNNIHLIAILPNDDWEAVLTTELLK